jgi:MFS family permease
MAHIPDDPATLARLRRRTTGTLVAGVALGSTGYIAAVTVSTIAAEDLAGSSAWAGVPGAAAVLGAAGGSILLSWIMVRAGRRAGLTAGYGLGVAGALVAVAALLVGSFPLLLGGTVLIGVANAASNLSRYAAADLVPPARRAAALGTVVWAATVGAVVGPNLVAFAGTAAEAVGLPRLTGAYLLPAVFVAGSAALTFALLRPDPFLLADPSARHVPSDGEGDPVRALLRRPTVVIALVALIANQAVMVLVMTMTPLHMTEHGHGLAAVGLVISAHTFGMFALSPVSGRLADRFGPSPVVVAGLVVSGSAAALSAAAPPDGGLLLGFALFLLGFGWNLGFVAGSSILTHGLAMRERTRLQGAADALVWSSSAVASVASGLVVAAAGFTALGLLGAALVAVPAWLVLGRRTSLEAVSRT